MPFTINGIGTSNYGARDFRPDGSYVTTSWFVLIFVPIFPLKSQRILPTGNNKFYLVYYSQPYLVLEKLPLNWTQVLSVYGWYAALWAFSGLALAGLWFFAIPAVGMLFVPWWLRRRAKTRMRESMERAQAGLGPEHDIGRVN
jgi:hypothetical protein